MQLFKNSFFINSLLLAILLRLLIMPFFFHPDIKTYHFQSSFLQKGVLDIYSYLPEHKGDLPLREEFVYFPLTYFTLGIYQIIITPLLGPDFYSWLNNASASAVEVIGVFRYLFLLKLPYLVLDILMAFLLTRFFTQESEKRKAFLFWLFNPFSIVILYVFSNVDIFPVLFTVLGLLFAKKHNFILAGLMIGLGAGFKAYPLILLPFLFFLADNWKQKIILILAAFIPLLLIIAPFLNSPGFQQATLNSGLTTRIISNGIPIGFGEQLFPGLILLGAIYFFAWQRKITARVIPIYSFIAILSIFMTTHFHIQWLFWFMPFGVLILILYKEYVWKLLMLLILAFSIPLLYNDSSMTVSTLSVINPLFQNLPTPFKLIGQFYDPVILQSILHSIFFGAGLITILSLLREEKE